MDSVKTSILYDTAQDYRMTEEPQPEKPRLFVCVDHEIMEFVLDGRQLLGRPSGRQIPDIPVVNRFVSRRQGWFETEGNRVTFTLEDTTNAVVFRRKSLIPGVPVEIWDGDELIIPTSRGDEGADIMLVCAILEKRINIWRNLKLASRDALTGLSGRNAFRTWYVHHFPWKGRTDTALFILDIDYFKRINDVYGHSAGDAALQTLTAELLLLVKNTGYVCRWGGDEFVGIMTGRDVEVKAKLDVLRQKLAGKKIDDSFTISISAGVADMRETDEDEIDAAVMLADQALYNAKEKGRNCVEMYRG